MFKIFSNFQFFSMFTITKDAGFLTELIKQSINIFNANDNEIYYETLLIVEAATQ